MKLIIIFLGVLFSTYAYAIADVEQDQVLIYQYGDGSTLKNNLNIFDNEQLKGEPVYIIEKENLKIKEKIISLKSPVSCKHLSSVTFNCDEIVLPVDFIKVRSRRLYLLVETKVNDLAKIRNKDKNYYLDLKKNDFIKSDWPVVSEWRSIQGSEAKLQLKSLMNDNSSLMEVIKSIQSCIKAIDKKCISKYSTDNIQFGQMLKYRAVADNPVLCKKFLEIWGDVFEDDMDYVLKNHPVADSETTWKNLEKVFFNLENSDVQVYLGTSKFLGVDSVTLSLKAGNNLKCENDTELQIQIKEVLNDITGKKEWKINYFTAYNRKSDRDKL